MSHERQRNERDFALAHVHVATADDDWLKIYDRQNEYAWIMSDTTQLARR